MQRNMTCLIMYLCFLSCFPEGLLADSADETDARLRKRIEELESENRALRRIINELKAVVSKVPEVKVQNQKPSTELRIMVAAGDWGGSSLPDIRKVCLSAATMLSQHLPDDGFAPITVQRGTSGPVTLYQRGAGNEYIVKLDTSNRAWAQCAFQFAHEFCHIVCNYRNTDNAQLWFEETLCECASLFALRRMSVEWRTNPPYSNWKSYSNALASYAEERISSYSNDDTTLADFYRSNKQSLEVDGTDRKLNTWMAVRLLPRFEGSPESWQALRYINLGPTSENQTFRAYLTGWHERVPEEHRGFVKSVAADFGVDLADPALDKQ